MSRFPLRRLQPAVPMSMFAFLLSCTGGPDAGGVGVGNPADMQASLARIAQGDTTTASVRLAELVVERCTGARESVPVDRVVDLLGPESFEVPGGEWCAVEADLADVLRVEGTRNDGARFAADLAVDRIRIAFTTPLQVDGGGLFLELGQPDWLNADELVLTLEGLTTFAADDPVSVELAQRLVSGTHLYEDTDDDGELDDDDRDDGEVGEIDDDDDDDDDDDTDESDTSDTGMDEDETSDTADTGDAPDTGDASDTGDDKDNTGDTGDD